KLMRPLTDQWRSLADEVLRPMLHFPRHPLQLARFARRAVRSATGIAQSWFRDDRTKPLFAGLAAHSFLSLNQIPSSAFAIVLGMFGHAVGWPMPRRGAQRVSQALAYYFQHPGGKIRTHTASNV